jgi:hypothetical protein
MRLDSEPSRLAGTRDQLLEVAHGHRRTALGHEHEWTFGLGIAMKSTEGTKLPTGERVRGWRALLDPTDVQNSAVEVDLIPMKVDKLRRSQAMPKRQQDHRGIAMRPTCTFAGLDQALDLALGQILTCPKHRIAGTSRRNFPFFGSWRRDPQG